MSQMGYHLLHIFLYHAVVIIKYLEKWDHISTPILSSLSSTTWQFSLL